MNSSRTTALKVTQGAVIAALYVALTLIFAPISFGEMQVRISEALTILPLFTPAAIPGLFLGCVLGNLLGGAIPLDVICGSLATLIGAVGGYLLRKNRWLVPLPTVLSNALIVPFVLRYGYGVPLPIPLMMVYVAAGEIPAAMRWGSCCAPSCCGTNISLEMRKRVHEKRRPFHEKNRFYPGCFHLAVPHGLGPLSAWKSGR